MFTTPLRLEHPIAFQPLLKELFYLGDRHTLLKNDYLFIYF